ncbi:hypothetical protein RFI_27179 [Reticulomyxa filosa]|uniref:Viral A-type inclusion protein n=1 Tax=Reticulomyxa filosa TaxID=46433 RepID=X6M886_RETFI|nr:hypothetical protein RFI_27179 [Reticulomyxa filosa]|eukprot:ETO10198.1 hypothetical protein RFI_27179 [Reticulomyxa filosa]
MTKGQKSKSTCETEWNELMSRVKTSEVEEQKVMKLLQSSISLATKLMSVINCYKDFYTISKMFERDIETKNEEYKSLREMLNDKSSHTDKAILTNIKSKKTDICQFVDQCLAKLIFFLFLFFTDIRTNTHEKKKRTNKESYLNRMSFVLKRFEECMQARNEVNTEETIANWYGRKREEMKTKETQLRQDVELLQKSLVTFDLLIGEAEKTLSTREHFKKDYIYVCLEGSETYQLKYLCAAYESQTYQIFNDIGEEQMNKKPLYEGKCTSRFLSKMESKINNQIEKGTGFIFDGHRFFCNDFFEYRCWKSYILTGHDLRQEQLEWNDQQEKKDSDPQNEETGGSEETGTNRDGSGPPTPRTRLRQRRASMSVMT